jgi:hypothetical protein
MCHCRIPEAALAQGAAEGPPDPRPETATDDTLILEGDPR